MGIEEVIAEVRSLRKNDKMKEMKQEMEGSYVPAYEKYELEKEIEELKWKIENLEGANKSISGGFIETTNGLKAKIQRLETDNACMMEYNAKMMGSLERAQRIENAYDILLEKYCKK